MTITFLGAAGEVTGSSYLLTTEQATVLIDCGAFQGAPNAGARNRLLPAQIEAAKLDAVLVTHGHLDHTGRLPLLARAGYAGPYYGSEATREMTGLILADAAKVLRSDLARVNRHRMRAGREPIGLPFEAADVEAVWRGFRTLRLHAPAPVASGVSLRLVEAGHMLGSTSFELTVESAGRRAVVVFSGDLGPQGLPILRDSEFFEGADAVVLESTYGDRDHRPMEETLKEFEAIVRDAVGRKRKILIPAFAIGRTQQILYHLAALFRSGAVPEFPVYIDSPMATRATEIYRRHPELYDEEASLLHAAGQFAVDLEFVKHCTSVEDSMALNNLTGPCAILAGSGMCTAGRIVHHLRNNLWNPATVVVIVGYQAEGTLGRQLVERRPFVRIFGERIAVKADIHTLGGFSAHAGQSDLLRWFAPLAASRPQVVLTHGESGPRESLARTIKERHQLQPVLPVYGEILVLATKARAG